LKREQNGRQYQTSNSRNPYQKKLRSDQTCKSRRRRCDREKAGTGQEAKKENVLLIVTTYHPPSYYQNTVFHTKKYCCWNKSSDFRIISLEIQDSSRIRAALGTIESIGSAFPSVVEKNCKNPLNTMPLTKHSTD